MDRRSFLKASIISSSVLPRLRADAPIAKRPYNKEVSLSMIGFGGIVVMGMEQKEADRTVAEAVARGINYFDVAPSYGNGEAEEKLGPALAPHRKNVFLACKCERRDAEGARQQLEQSLETPADRPFRPLSIPRGRQHERRGADSGPGRRGRTVPEGAPGRQGPVPRASPLTIPKPRWP